MKRSFHISTTPRSILATSRSRKAYAFARTHAVAILKNDSVNPTAARGAASLIIPPLPSATVCSGIVGSRAQAHKAAGRPEFPEVGVPLFLPQRDHRVDTARVARRQKTCEKRSKHQHGNHSRETRNLHGLHPLNQLL
jgi:hypothetical protein